MRTNLLPLLGKTAFVEGHYVEQRIHNNGVQFCLKNPRIHLYNIHRQIRIKSPYTSLDHLWVYLSSEQCEGFHEPRYSRVNYTGLVKTYERHDSSIDVHVSVTPHINSDRLLCWLYKYESQVDQISLSHLQDRYKQINEAWSKGQPFLTYLYNMTPETSFYEIKSKLSRMINTHKRIYDRQLTQGSAIFIS